MFGIRSATSTMGAAQVTESDSVGRQVRRVLAAWRKKEGQTKAGAHGLGGLGGEQQRS